MNGMQWNEWNGPEWNGAMDRQTSILAQIGNEGDNPDTVNSIVTAVHQDH